MSAIEIAATLLGLINVWLIVRRNIWNYPFGLAMVVLYGKIFFDAKLYSDALLQGYYVAIQLYGWWFWLRGRADDGRIIVVLMDGRARLSAIGIVAGGAALLGWLMASQTDASLPYWDATTTVMSVVAQFLLSRRRLECWLLWITVDVLSIGIYAYKELYLTAGLYTVFLGLASWGLVAWHRAWRQAGRPGAPDPAGAPA